MNMLSSIMKFEMKQQLKSLLFLLCMCIYAFSIFQQCSTYLLYYPIQSDRDVKGAAAIGHSFLYVDTSPEEQSEFLANYLLGLEAEDFPDSQDKYVRLQQLGEKIHMERMSGEAALQYTESHEPDLKEWVEAGLLNDQRLGSVQEINENMHREYSDKSFTDEFSLLFADLTQVFSSLLVFPLFGFMFTNDNKYRTQELIRSKQVIPWEYILGRYLGRFLITSFFILVISLIFNGVVIVRFYLADWNINLFTSIVHYVVLILPSLFFSSALSVALSLAIGNSLAAIPVFLLYAFFNISEELFTGVSQYNTALYKFIVRGQENLQVWGVHVLFNRLLYISCAVVMLFVSWKVWEKRRLHI